MTRSVLAALVFGSAAIVAAPVMAHAQNFKVEKFDIKGDGGTDYVARSRDLRVGRETTRRDSAT